MKFIFLPTYKHFIGCFCSVEYQCDVYGTNEGCKASYNVLCFD